jgi:hypothetical protein
LFRLGIARSLRALTIAALVLVASTGATRLATAQQRTTDFVPASAFGGYSQGDGTSQLLLRPSRPFHVESHGYALPDGTFRLDQATTFAGQPTTTRFWIIRTVGDNKFSATLSDAPGLVAGATVGDRLSLSYRIEGPFVLHQQLRLIPDGKTIDNVGRVTLFGIPVGWLHETITRKD